MENEFNEIETSNGISSFAPEETNNTSGNNATACQPSIEEFTTVKKRTGFLKVFKITYSMLLTTAGALGLTFFNANMFGNKTSATSSCKLNITEIKSDSVYFCLDDIKILDNHTFTAKIYNRFIERTFDFDMKELQSTNIYSFDQLKPEFTYTLKVIDSGKTLAEQMFTTVKSEEK